ncbi:MAG: penicillin-binding protein 2 [Candidatus Nomurabacteria bacterium]|jgi:cell division protein FtsI/penicillin-binding protein 2|nr:penicillin-binding protein 2 [Candidatus Nomurabacteria bacterium]
MNRVTILKIGLIVAVAIIGVRLFQIQIIDHEKYALAAESEHTRKFELLAERGNIYMLDGDSVTPVVMNETVWTVFVDPSYVGDKDKVQAELTKILGEKIFAKWDDVWSDLTKQYFEVAKNVSYDEITAMKSVNLKGVGQKASSRRVYPYGTFASQVLGFINAEGVGYGVEHALRNELAGTNGLLKTVADVNNIPLTIGDSNVRVPAIDGKNIALTIDENIQRATEKALEKSLKKEDISAVSAVVVNPNNGQVYAMANLPGFDPETYWKVSDPEVYKNRVLVDPYEAASVCKTFTFAAAIENGSIKPTDTYTNTGSTKVDDRTIQNARYSTQFGNITFQTALSNSLNTGSVEVLRRMGGGQINKSARNLLYDAYYNRFGLGKTTGIELYEVPGVVISPDEVQGNAVRYANMTFGQGMDITMIQTIAAFSSVINGGNYYTPTVIAGEVVQGKLVANDTKPPTRQTISSNTSATMRDMLVGVRGVVGKGNDLPGYRVGVKSGTAETYDEKGNYTSDRTIASLIGFGGADDGSLPDYVVMVRVEGDKLLWGSVDAEPIFTEISNFMLGYLKIKPKG